MPTAEVAVVVALVVAAAAAKPNLNCVAGVDVAAAVALLLKPNINLGAPELLPCVPVSDPGLSCSQQMHLLRAASFCAIHASQFQLLDFCAAASCWKPVSDFGTSAAEAKPNLKLLLVVVMLLLLLPVLLLAFGLGVSHATHLLLLL